MKSFTELMNEIDHIRQFSIIESHILSPEESEIARKKAAAPTGEAAIARSLQDQFKALGVDKYTHMVESMGLQSIVKLTDPNGKEIKAKALFWYDRNDMKITANINGIKRISFKGRKDSKGYFTKFSVTEKTSLRASDEAYQYIK